MQPAVPSPPSTVLPPPPTTTPSGGFTQFVAWAAKNLLLPLTPFITGALIRGVSGVQGYQSVFDVGELSFSMAMLCLLVVVSAGRVQDQNLRESLVGIWIFAGVIFLALFVVSTFVKIEIDAGTTELLQSFQAALSHTPPSNVAQIASPEVSKLAKMLDRIWIFAAVPAIPTAVLAAACKFGYKLED
jgi:hypothetical protein